MAESAIDLKVVALGAASVGKTSVIHRYCNGTFRTDTSSTIGAGFFTHTFVLGQTEVTLLLWDTAGEERFRSVAPSLLRGANGLILGYDVTQPGSVDELSIYLEMFLDTVQVDLSCELPVLLLGNKCDIEERIVSEATIDAWLERNREPEKWICSAKTGENVEEAITTLVQALLNPRRTNHRPTLQVTPIPASQGSSCC